MVKLLGAACTAFVIPILGFLSYFSLFMPLKLAFSSMMLPYSQMLERQVVGNLFYRSVAGTVDVKESIGQIALSLLFYIVFAGACFFCSFIATKLKRRWCRNTLRIAILLGVLLLISANALTQSYWWLIISLRGLPIVLCATLGIYLYQLYIKGDSGYLPFLRLRFLPKWHWTFMRIIMVLS
jgi:hypothetical protein